MSAMVNMEDILWGLLAGCAAVVLAHFIVIALDRFTVWRRVNKD